MHWFLQTKGSISLVLAVLFVPMMLFSGLLTQVISYLTTEVLSNEASALSLNAILANFDAALQTRYGLFAVSQSGESIESIGYEHYVQTMGFHPERFEVEGDPESSYANPLIIEHGIRNFMQIRGLSAAAERLLSSFEFVKQAAEGIESNFLALDAELEQSGSPQEQGQKTTSDTDTSDSDATYSLKNLLEKISELTNQANAVASAEEKIQYSSDLFNGTPSGESPRITTPTSADTDRGILALVGQFKEMADEVRNFFSGVDPAAGNLWTNFLLAEYVTEHFSHRTTNPDQTNASGIEISPEENRLFGCETEYILYGSKGEPEKKLLWFFTIREASGPESNLATAKRNLLATRFALNSIYAFRSVEIDANTLAVSIALQSATGGYIPYQVFQVTLKLSLALLESILDVQALLQGERIPLFKSVNSWTCSVSGLLEWMQSDLTEGLYELSEQVVKSGFGLIEDCIRGAVEFAEEEVESGLNAVLREIEAKVESRLKILLHRGIEEIQKQLNSILDLNSHSPNIVADLKEAFALLEEWVGEEYINAKLQETFDRSGEDLSAAVASVADDLFEQAEAALMAKVQEVSKMAEKKLREMAQNMKGQSAGDLTKALGYEAYDLIYANEEGETEPFSLSYGDYMQLFMVLKFFGDERDQMLLRIADLIQINLSQQDPNYSMFKAFTKVSLQIEIYPEGVVFWAPVLEWNYKSKHYAKYR